MKDGWERTGTEGTPPGNVLVTSHDSTNDPDLDAIEAGTSNTHRVGVVSSDAIEDWLSSHQHPAGASERITLFTIGGTVRSGTATAPTTGASTGVPRIVSVDDQMALDDLGDRLATELDSDEETILEFDALDTVLDAAPLPAVFAFLHMVTRLVDDADASARYRLDPARHDASTIATLEPLFDAAR